MDDWVDIVHSYVGGLLGHEVMRADRCRMDVRPGRRAVTCVRYNRTYIHVQQEKRLVLSGLRLWLPAHTVSS